MTHGHEIESAEQFVGTLASIRAIGTDAEGLKQITQDSPL